jgi:hypothetical protein
MLKAQLSLVALVVFALGCSDPPAPAQEITPVSVAAQSAKPIAQPARPAPAKKDTNHAAPPGWEGKSQAEIDAEIADGTAGEGDPMECAGNAGFSTSNHDGWKKSTRKIKLKKKVFLYDSLDTASSFGKPSRICKTGETLQIIGDGFVQGFAACMHGGEDVDCGYVNITGADGDGMVD